MSIKVSVKSAATRRSEREAEYLEVAAVLKEKQSWPLIVAEAERLPRLLKLEHKLYKQLNRGERVYIKSLAVKGAPAKLKNHVKWAARTSWEDNMNSPVPQPVKRAKKITHVDGCVAKVRSTKQVMGLAKGMLSKAEVIEGSIAVPDASECCED